MSFIFDKAIDGIFIFLGVYVAFAFGQYQEDQRNKEELSFNLQQIIRQLPNKKPTGEVEKFQLKMVKNDEGYCDWNHNYLFSNHMGSDYLRVIKNRGLSRYLKSQYIIAVLTSYFQEQIPGTKEAFSAYDEEMKQFTLLQNKYAKNCVPKKEISKWENRIRPLYIKWKLAETIEKEIGFVAYQELQNLGYKDKRERKKMKLWVEVKEVDPKEKNKEKAKDSPKPKSGS